MAKLNEIDICNLALDQIGQTSISSFTDGSDAAPKCERNYNHTLRCVLRAGRWKSARIKVKLSQRTDVQDPAVPAPSSSAAVGVAVGGWPPGASYNIISGSAGDNSDMPSSGDPRMAYAFQLPPDYLRLVRFNDVDSAVTSYPFWEIRADVLWTNQTMAFLEYVRDVSMPGSIEGSNPPTIGTLDPDLQDVIVIGLAARLAWFFQQSQRLQDQLKKDFERVGSRALAVDARSEKIALRNPAIDSTWVRSRWVSTNA